MPRQPIELPLDDIATLYATGSSTVALARQFHCSPTTIAAMLHKRGITMRRSRFDIVPISEAALREQYECNACQLPRSLVTLAFLPARSRTEDTCMPFQHAAAKIQNGPCDHLLLIFVSSLPAFWQGFASAMPFSEAGVRFILVSSQRCGASRTPGGSGAGGPREYSFSFFLAALPPKKGEKRKSYIDKRGTQ